MRINELESDASRDMLEFLFPNVLKPKYRYVHHWTVGDVLIGDHLGAWHCAVADYTAGEHWLMKRCQVLADKVFDPGFLEATLGAHASA